MFSAIQYIQSGDKAGERCMRLVGKRRPCRLAVAPMDNARASSSSGVFTVPGEGSIITTFQVFIF
jgi:hypothetical protein